MPSLRQLTAGRFRSLTQSLPVAAGERLGGHDSPGLRNSRQSVRRQCGSDYV
ncbi:MAG: hypothetical protein J6Y33_07540 [Prevotella sp.]|nr:hypothetical protein [Prevotella sp.]